MFSYPTPFTPPTTEDDRLSWLRLIRSRRVGVATFHRLIADHGTAEAALAALPDIARAAGVEGYEPCPEGVVAAEVRAARKAGARLVCLGDPAYPADLAQVSDAPPVFWLRGDPSILARPMVALVGARNASSLGGRMGKALAEGLSEAGIVVVSGLARGIDTVAHRAALRGGTVAVMAGGPDVVYPPENAALAAEIAAQGAIVSEQPPGLEPQARHFPLRNRIISGLSRAVVVVEAAPGSGSLITARMALDQGREVMAVPGHPFDARAGGCNQLIRDGAALVRGAADVLSALGIDAAEAGQREAGGRTAPVGEAIGRPDRDGTAGRAGNGGGAANGETESGARAQARGPGAAAASRRSGGDPGGGAGGDPGGGAGGDALHRRILASLGPSPLAEDQLIRDLGEPTSRVTPELVALELEGRIARQAGGLLARVD